MEFSLLNTLIKYREGLISRDFITDYFVEADYMSEEDVIRTRMVKPGKFFTRENKLYLITEAKSKTEVTVAVEIPFPAKKLSFYDRFILRAGNIENHTEGSMETTLGVFLLNYVALVKPFGDIIPYVNGAWNMKKIEAKIAKLTIDGIIKPAQVFKYIDYVYSLSGLNDFCVPALSEKCITASPEIDKRRDALFEQYKDQLDDPNVMIMIEDELIKMDKEYLSSDMSSGFMIKGKNFNVQRKRMFLSIGMLETFGDTEKGYNFSTTNLNDGWKTDEMHILSNDIRRGSYDRAKSTALGGAESKMIGRNFQDSAIITDDCGTKRGLKILLTKDNLDKFLYRNIIVNNKVIELTNENVVQYIDKEIEVRSPMYCASVNGYCYTCVDTRFKAIGVKLLNIQPIAIGSQMVTLSLKAMHGTKVDFLKIDDMNTVLI